ncbi:MAG: 30S ribosomal protein S6--L-glutamate ligase [Crocinitomicaceae bacterium]|nr:30S ribosomal protein S6--L-glutamate ligase [Crocinitomicaceae bacterium]
MADKNLPVIGSEEWCAFPSLKVPAIRARIDSGAKTSSMHASNIKPFKKDGEQWVRFEIHPIPDMRKIVLPVEYPVLDTRKIKNTSGVSEERYVIRTEIQIGEDIYEIDLTLANRDAMGFRMLLGREAMNGRFLVDPSESYLIQDYNKTKLKSLYKSIKPRSSGLRIGLLASNPELYSNKRLMEAAEERGHTIHFVKVEHCYMKMDSNAPEIKSRGKVDLNDLDAIIPRIKPSMTHYGCALIRQFDTSGAYCLNDDRAIRHSRDKLYAAQIFTAKGISTPVTCFGKSPLDTKGLIEMVNGAPLIIKLLESTQGKGVVLAETNKAAESVINAFKSLNANILVQEFIKEAGGKDIRCFVVDGKVVASIQREAQKGEFRSNVHQGGTASVVRITAEERRLAVKAAKVFNLPVAGVDILRSNRGPMVLEVNSSPGLEGIEGATGVDIAGRIIQAIEKKLKYTPQPVVTAEEL